jgi:hypothetical protein
MQRKRFDCLFYTGPSYLLQDINPRCVIRYTYAETDNGRTSDTALITLLCSHFENGVSNANALTIAAKNAEKARASQRTTDAKTQFTLKELDWFSQNAYNCAVNGCEKWETQHIISITESCLRVHHKNYCH